MTGKKLIRLQNVTIHNHPFYSNFHLNHTFQWDAQLYLAAGLILLALLQTQVNDKNKIISFVFALICLIMTIILAPVCASVLFILALYRKLVDTILSISNSPQGKYDGLLKGCDVFWGLEEDASLSVINVLAFVDFSFIVSARNNGNEPLETLQGLIFNRLIESNEKFSKLTSYRRQSALGYLYWERQSDLSIEDHVRWLQVQAKAEIIPEDVLREAVSDLANKPLPADHSAGWEILVGRYPVMEMGVNSCLLDINRKYPILFRIHHSMGDGVALVRLFTEILSDPNSRSNSPVSWRSKSPDRSFYPQEIAHGNSDADNWTHKTRLKSPRRKSKGNYSPSSSPSLECLLTARRERLAQRCSPVKFPKRRKSADGTDLEIDRIKLLQPPLGYESYNLKQIMSHKNKIFSLLACAKKTFDHCSNLFLFGRSEVKCRTRPGIVISDIDQVQKFGDKDWTSWVRTSGRFILSLVRTTMFLSFAPASVANQIILKASDVNILHNSELSGKKVVAWHLERHSDANQSLFEKIRRIRTRTNSSFSEVLLTAVSIAFEAFFKENDAVPAHLTAVLPSRVPILEQPNAYDARKQSSTFPNKVQQIMSETCEVELDNRFTVAMLTLPIFSDSEDQGAIFEKLRRVRTECGILKKSPDYLVNYWLLNVIATFFPVWLLRPILRSTKSSLVVSNVPGPKIPLKLAGHLLHNIVFWVPNRNTTGVGVSLLSYAGKFQLGLMADQKFISHSEDGQKILEKIVKTIDKIAAALCDEDIGIK